MPWATAGATPTVSDVSAVAVVDGTTEVIGPPDHAGQVRGQLAAVLQLEPTQAVDHQQHHLAGASHRLGQPGRPLPRVPASSAGTSPGQVGAPVVGQHRRGNSHRPTP